MAPKSEISKARTVTKAVRACSRGSFHAVLGTLALLFSLAFAQAALAGPPAHLHTPALDLTGGPSDPGPIHPAQPFNHACGTAIDSKGDVYVSAAGNNAIDVFNPTHEYLTFIPDTNEPCGLAVNGKGELFVTEKALGKVVRYKPNAYPFSGTPTYTETKIDESGNAKGITVDPFDNSLYVAEGNRIAMYNSEGTAGINEEQFIAIPNATGGFYKLIFKGEETVKIAWNAPNTDPGTPEVIDSIQEALEALTTIGAGNVAVSEGPLGPKQHLVTFKGALGGTDVEQLQKNTSELTGSINIETNADGFNGHIGEGELTNATGVASYTFKPTPTSTTVERYVFAADEAGTGQVKVFGGPDIRALELRRTVEGVDQDRDPKTPDQSFGFGPGGAYLAADKGYCPKEAEDPKPKQACTAGHFFVYDAAHEALDEFEASGQFLTQVPSPEPPSSFVDAQPTAMAVDRSGGPGDGTSYVTSSASAGAKALAFSPLPPPRRLPRPDLSFALPNACGVAVDSAGNSYVAAGSSIHVYDPEGNPVNIKGPKGEEGKIEDANEPCDLAVDSAGRIYALDRGGSKEGDEKAVYYTPNSFPPKEGTKYSGPTVVADASPKYFPLIEGSHQGELHSIGINPKNGHLFVSQSERTIELGSVEEGSPTLDSCFACFGLGFRADIAAYGENGNVYVSAGGTIYVFDEKGEEILARISGTGSPKGLFSPGISIAVDQTNGHVIAFEKDRKVAEEYEASGTFVAQFGSFQEGGGTPRVAVDDGKDSPNRGNVYIAFFGALSAFAPLSYAEAPIASTGTASEVGGGKATLNGTVDPRGFELEECHFEYLTDAEYENNEEEHKPLFTGAEEEPCAESLEEIGSGTGPVAVHADLTNLDPEGRYRFRLFAENEFGAGEGKAGLFGPPLPTTKSAQPVSYVEATLRARIDPSGLATKYHFEYLTDAQYKHNEEEANPGFENAETTSEASLQPGVGPSPTEVKVPIFGLKEGTTYHFRVLAENEAKEVAGLEQTLRTLVRAGNPPCPNDEFRTGPSANLPDCRAYELVTPADTRGLSPLQASGSEFSDWPVTPRGEGAGERLTFYTTGTLPGFEGGGVHDGYRAERAKGEGLHPTKGWTSKLVGPSFAQAVGDPPGLGAAPDQLYSLWEITPVETFEGTFPEGVYLRMPDGTANPECMLEPQTQLDFELVGCGSLGVDPHALGHLITNGGAHVIFESDAHLEPSAPANGTTAVYDRAASAASATVVSLDPNGNPFGAGENATYVGATEDGSAILFEVGGALYLHREGQSIEVAEAPNTFAAVSADGQRVFYAETTAGDEAAELFACEIETGPCAGPGAHAPTLVAPDSIFINVSADGSHVYFTSKERLDGGEEGVPGADNLYLWDGAETRFIALLDPKDMVHSFVSVSLLNWVRAIGPNNPSTRARGRGLSPTRSTAAGEVLVFESRAQLTSYDNTEAGAAACGKPEVAGDRCKEVYRYDATDGSLLCVSCDPSGARPNGDATLQDLSTEGTPAAASALTPNLTEDGQAVFFGSKDSLLPADANSVRDVYEWKAPGEGEAGSCDLPGGCLALISSGQGERDSFLYGMTPDGHDVFFSTLEKLVGADILGSPSIYDARIGGGIPDPPAPAPCQGDACQGEGSTPPALPAPTSSGSGDGNAEPEPPPRCAKGKHRLKGRCVAKHHKRHHHRRRANQNRGAQR